MDQPLTPAEMDQICLVLRVGCSRTAACEYTGVVPVRLAAAMDSDAQFDARVVRAEVHPEVRHMGVVSKAAEDEKNWRSSVWWLEQRRRERQAAGGGSVEDAVRAALVRFAELVARQIPSLQRRHAIVVELLQLAGEAATAEGDAASASAAASVPPTRDDDTHLGEAEDDR